MRERLKLGLHASLIWMVTVIGYSVGSFSQIVLGARVYYVHILRFEIDIFLWLLPDADYKMA
jgi:hypothetical protein